MRRARRGRKASKHISISAGDAEWETVRRNADRRGLSIARYLVELVERDGPEEDAGPALALAAEEQRELLEAVREVRALMLEGEEVVPLEWCSVEPTKIRRSEKLIGAYYRNELARRLQALGMAVSPTLVGRVPGFELAGYERSFLDAFSGRRREILAHLELPYTAANAQMAALPRLPRNGVAEWAGTRPTRPRSQAPAELSPEPELGVLEAVVRAVAHVAERRTAIPEAEVRAVALGHAPGRYTLGEVDAAIARLVRGGELIEAERRGIDRAFVTDRAVRAERRVLASMDALTPDCPEPPARHDSLRHWRQRAESLLAEARAMLVKDGLACPISSDQSLLENGSFRHLG